MNSINSRFKQIMKDKNLTPNEMGNMLGMTAIYIRKLTQEGASFGIEPIKKILISFPDINARWFLIGEDGSESFSNKDNDGNEADLIMTNRNLSETVKNLSETIKLLSNK